MHDSGQNREDYALTWRDKIQGFVPTAHCTIYPRGSLDVVSWTMSLARKQVGRTKSILGPQRDRGFWTVRST